MWESALPKGNDFDADVRRLGRVGVGHPKGSELSGGLEMVGLRIAMANLLFAPQAGRGRNAQSCPQPLGG